MKVDTRGIFPPVPGGEDLSGVAGEVREQLLGPFKSWPNIDSASFLRGIFLF